jgi:hypothetical protein
MFWNVDKEETIAPPTKTKFFLSGIEMVLVLVEFAICVSYLSILLWRLLNIVFPPHNMMLKNNSFLISKLHLETDW